MKIYSNFIFPRIYDCVMDKPGWYKHRKKQLVTAEGKILEIGVGTGLNLPHYPSHVRQITTVDPNPGMNKKLQSRINQTEIEVVQKVISSESLPFEEGSFDCVVSTITLCSIQNVNQAVNELFRVLKPGGRFLFFEHGLSPDQKVANWQRRMNWIQKRVGDGCTLSLDVPELISSQPFSSVEMDKFYLNKTPKTHGYMYQGIAIK